MLSSGLILNLIKIIYRYYKKRYLMKSDTEMDTVPASINKTTPLKEKTVEDEKKTEEPRVSTTSQVDEPAIQETSFCEYL